MYKYEAWLYDFSTKGFLEQKNRGIYEGCPKVRTHVLFSFFPLYFSDKFDILH